MEGLSAIDMIGRALVLVLLLTGLIFHRFMLDCTDGNVERLIREHRQKTLMAARARVLLAMMRKERVA